MSSACMRPNVTRSSATGRGEGDVSRCSHPSRASVGTFRRRTRTSTPDLVVPGHCTGWRAQHSVAAALQGAYTSSNVGTTFTFTAA